MTTVAPSPSRLLQAQLRPLAVLVATVVAAAVPLVWLWLQVAEQQATAERVSQQVAQLIQREVAAQPELWRYDTLKLQDRIEGWRHGTTLATVAVADHHGVVLSVPDGSGLRATMPWTTWRRTALTMPEAAEVAVAMDLRPLWRTTAALLGVGLALGLLLALLMLAVPMRAVRRAESEVTALLGHVEQQRSELQDLATTLEERVAERSQALRTALTSLRAQEQHIRDLAARAIRLQEGERRAIARDLHDSIGQALTAIRLRLQVLQQHAPAASSERQTLAALTAAVDDVLDETRSAVQRLAPPLLTERGLAGALRQVCSALEHGGTPKVTLRSGDLPPLDSATEVACLRIVQEALNNALRHSGAHNIAVEVGVGSGADGLATPANLASCATVLQVSVQDDGHGLPAQIPEQGHGLRNLRERAELLGGACDIRSDANGCTVRVYLPLSRTTTEEP